jgi:hypothetical protein
MSGTAYREGHYGALMKASARLSEAREFIAMFDSTKTIAKNAEHAQSGRWYGNVSPAVCRELTRFFSDRFIPLPDHLLSLRRILTLGEDAPLPVLNHFYMILRDPYYRWAASDWLPGRMEAGLTEIPRNGFEDEAKKVLADILGPKTVTRYCRNILTSLRDNGYLSGAVKKEITSPAIPAVTLGFMLYTLKELGEGFNEFDGSPLCRAYLKPRELLLPLFQEGERRRWWEFTGDRTHIRGSFTLHGLDDFLSEVGI